MKTNFLFLFTIWCLVSLLFLSCQNAPDNKLSRVIYVPNPLNPTCPCPLKKSICPCTDGPIHVDADVTHQGGRFKTFGSSECIIIGKNNYVEIMYGGFITMLSRQIDPVEIEISLLEEGNVIQPFSYYSTINESARYSNSSKLTFNDIDFLQVQGTLDTVRASFTSRIAFNAEMKTSELYKKYNLYFNIIEHNWDGQDQSVDSNQHKHLYGFDVRICPNIGTYDPNLEK